MPICTPLPTETVRALQTGGAAHVAALLAREEVAYVHVRSTRNNCYQFRIDRG